MFNKLKIVLALGALALVAFKSYDYGVSKTTAHYQQEEINRAAAQLDLYDRLEAAENDAFTLSLALANQKPVIQEKFKTIEKKVIKYVQSTNTQCVIHDSDRLQLRAEAIHSYNAAIPYPAR